MSYCKFGIITSHMSEGFLENRQSQMVSTPWGEAKVYTGLVNGVNTAVILRYGDHADMASHLVNFRSNIWGLKKLGVKQIISQNAIGSCNPHIRPGDFVCRMMPWILRKSGYSVFLKIMPAGLEWT